MTMLRNEEDSGNGGLRHSMPAAPQERCIPVAPEALDVAVGYPHPDLLICKL